MEFEISFLNQTNPKFTTRGISANEFAPRVNRQIVIDGNSSPSAIYKEFYNILTGRIVNRLPISILWIDVPRNKFSLAFVFELIVSSNSQTTQHGTITNLSL